MDHVIIYKGHAFALQSTTTFPKVEQAKEFVKSMPKTRRHRLYRRKNVAYLYLRYE